jgi:hypothetical protein
VAEELCRGKIPFRKGIAGILAALLESTDTFLAKLWQDGFDPVAVICNDLGTIH